MHRTLLLTIATCLFGSYSRAQDPVARTPVQVDVGISGLPTGIGVHGDQTSVATIYLDGGAESVHVAVSKNGGATFAPPIRVDNDTGGAVKRVGRDSVRVCGDRVYAVWRDARGSTATDDLYFNFSSDGGASFQAQDLRLGDGAAGANEVIDWRFAFNPDPTGDDLYVLMTSEVVGGNGNEELFLVVSLDGGLNWSNAIQIGGDDTAGVDVDQLALAVDGDVVHMAWEDDGGTSGTDSVLYQRTTDAGVTLLPTAIALDPSDASGSGDAASSSDTGLTLSAEGLLVVAAWPEERTDPADEELRVNVSTDGGQSWGTDQRVGGYDPSTDDIDSCSALVAGGVIAVTWDDNRDMVGFNRTFVAVSTNSGAAFVETPLSGLEGGSFPRLVGDADKLAVLYTSDAGVSDRAAASFSIDAGATWAAELALSDNAAGDADATDGCFVPALENVLAVFLSDATGTNGVFVGGFSLCDDGSSIARNGGANPLSLTAEVPRLGATWNASVDLALTGHGFAAVLGYGSPASLTLAGGQVLLVNIADPGGELLGLTIMGGSPAQFSSIVPNVPSFCGLSISIQALHFGSATPFALSNAVDLIVSGI